MTVVTSFYDKQRDKQIDFERKVLQDLAFPDIEEACRAQFEPFFSSIMGYQAPMQEVCIDYAIEAYLLGASFGRFGYYGEPIDQVRRRSERSEYALVSDLFDYWCYWSRVDERTLESIYEATRAYIGDWWQRGFENCKKRYRLHLN